MNELNSNTPSQPPIEAVTPQHNANRENQEPPRRHSEPNVPPPSEGKHDREHCRPDQTPWWKHCMELAAILVGIAVAVIYYRQLKEMHKSTEAAQGAAIVATDTLKDARKNWQIEHRPIIWLTNQNYVPTYIDQSQQVVWDFHFANYGTVPIQKSECMKYMKIGDRDYEVSYGAKEPSIGPPLPPGGTVDYSMTVVSAPGVTKERFRRLLKIDNSISIKAVFEYTDVTGAKYQTGICLTRLASGAIAYCKDGNYIH